MSETMSKCLTLPVALLLLVLTGCSDLSDEANGHKTKGNNDSATEVVESVQVSSIDPAVQQATTGVTSIGREVKPGEVLTFPQDHGPHPDYGLEWWYLTANLEDSEGEQHGIQFTLFRFRGPQQHQGPWWQGQWYMAHAMWDHKDSHLAEERFGRGDGQAGIVSFPFAAWLDDWRIASANTDQDSSFLPLALNVKANGFSFILTLDDSPLVKHGLDGYSDKSGDGVLASYYYSYPRLTAHGEISTPSGDHYTVTGTAWFDREWSSALLDERFAGWDWFGINLNDGRSLMLFCLRGAPDNGSHCDGSLIQPDGRKTIISGEDFSMKQTKFVELENSRYPIHWQLEIPSQQLNLSVATNSKDQLNRLTTQYWEGPITVAGSHSGYGFIEMTGRELFFR